MPIDELPYEVEIIELNQGVHKGFPFSLECRKLFHPVYCLGYRIGWGKKSIAFCTDTGRCDSMEDLAQGATMLIAECAAKEGGKSTAWPHLTSLDVAKIAIKADVEMVSLIHFDADNFGSLSERKEAETKAKMIYENTIAVHDGMEIII